MIAILILLEDGDQSVVDLNWLFVLLSLLLEVHEELGDREEGETPYA